MHTKKRGQVTLFIILGLVIVIILGIAIYIVTQTDLAIGDKEKGRTLVEGQVANLQATVKRCSEGAAKFEVAGLLVNGGKKYTQPFAKDYYGAKVNYLLYDGQNNMNLRAEIERVIKDEVIRTLKEDCSLKQYKDINPRLDKKNIEADVTLLDEEVKISIVYPITLKKSGYETIVSDFKTNIKTSFGRLYRVADTVVNTEVNGDDFSVVDYLMTFPEVWIERDGLTQNEHVYTVSLQDRREFLIFATKT